MNSPWQDWQWWAFLAFIALVNAPVQGMPVPGPPG
jgi:hypothetical protein